MQRLTPEQYRKQYISLLSNAKQLSNQKKEKQAIELFVVAFEAFDTYEFNKTIEDYRSISRACYTAATDCYNNFDFVRALTFYQKGSEYINRNISALSDNDCRLLIESYIDMSDAYLNLYDRENANIAFLNAITAFQQISCKTADELVVSNKNDNYVSFREFYEKKTTTKEHLASSLFQNNQHLLYDKRDDDMVLNGISTLYVNKAMQAEANLYSMFNQMTITTQSPFLSMPADQNISDHEYRHIARELINLGENHLRNKTSDQLSTFRQALSVYNKIRFKEASDQLAIQALEQHIGVLQQQALTPPPTSTPMQTETQMQMQTQTQNNHRLFSMTIDSHPQQPPIPQPAQPSALAQFGTFSQQQTNALWAQQPDSQNYHQENNDRMELG